MKVVDFGILCGSVGCPK